MTAPKLSQLSSLGLASLLLTALLPKMLSAEKLTYPPAPKTNQVDTYGTEQVADPYRPLEDDRSPETLAWVAAENKLTSEYFSKIPYREMLKDRLTRLQDYAKYTDPVRKGAYLFFRKNNGLQNQSVVYKQQGPNAEPEVLLDPNKLSADGTSRVLITAPSKTGKYMAYTVSGGGSDWQEAYILDVATAKPLADHLKWLKVSGLAWAGDGFFYSRYDAPAPGHELSSKNEFHKVYFHRVGTEQAQDQLVYQDKVNPQRFNVVYTTPDERFAILSVSERGNGKDGNALFFREVAGHRAQFTPIIPDITNDQYRVIAGVGSKFLVQTNAGAPNGRIARYDPTASTDKWTSVVAEKEEPIESSESAGGKLFITYTKDVTARAYVYSLEGKLENEILLPGLGSVAGFSGNPENRDVFFMFTSFETPATILNYDIASRTSKPFRTPDIPGYNPARYETRQVFYTSKDGTRIPMFLVAKKGLKLDGANPTLLEAYGGFNISLGPYFSALRLALLEQGFVFAQANLRGGGEYGEAWHQAGTKAKKQNVFDDFIAAAEWLIQNQYTSPEHLAIHGVSNGGLLIGAVINQRPELFRVAIPQAGVMDMLRFQRFTIGWNWIADYGSSEKPEEFKALRAYSPIHNIRAGVKYPATLITTADHDDRVVPGHSFKYAATLQAKASPENPVLIRIDTNSGHGPSSVTKALEQTADLYAFLFYNLGITPAAKAATE